MRYPTLDLASIWDNYPDIFDNFKFPKIYEPAVDGTVTERDMTDDEKAELIDNILFRTEGLEALYTDPVILKNRIGVYSRIRSRVWDDYSRGLGFRWTYNPTENVFEKSHTVRTVAVEGANANNETRNLTSASNETRNLATDDVETRNLANASSDNKNYNANSMDELNLHDSSAKVLDLVDGNTENRNLTSNKSESKTGNTSDTEERNLTSASANVKAQHDITTQSTANSANESSTNGYSDTDTETRKTTSGESNVKNLSDSESVTKGITDTVHTINDDSTTRKPTLTHDEWRTGAEVNMVDGYAGTGSGSSGTASITNNGGSGSYTGSLPVDNARADGSKMHSNEGGTDVTDFDGDKTETTSHAGSDTTTATHTGSENKSGSVIDEYIKSDDRNEHAASAKSESGTLNSDVAHTGTDNTTTSDSGSISRSGASGEVVSGQTVEGGSVTSNATHSGTESLTEAHGGYKSNNEAGFETNAHSGSETGDITRRNTQSGGVSTTGTQGGSVSNEGQHRENTTESNSVDRHGNIGVTKSSELIMDQLELIKNNLFEFVTNDVKHNMTLEIY